ncbi:MAG UNVERIFIED_CONTAM: FAD-dependent oxidoreductase [Anaerolineae bacterium]|jgi:glycine/D-amino acid oxidase-like deaminating enzyme
MIARQQADVAIIGAGMAGLAHALEAAKRGLKVVVFERHPQAVGSSVRNFGMIFPFGVPHELREIALRGRAIWLEVAQQAGFWVKEAGGNCCTFSPCVGGV